MRKLREYCGNEAGVTFIEILIVVIIIGFIASIVAPSLFGQIGKTKLITAEAQIKNIEAGLEQYYLDCGQFPTTDQGLRALMVKPNISPVPKGWDGPYFKRDIPKDPWGNEFIYKSPGLQNPKTYDLYSFGKDGQVGGAGEAADITNWSNLE